MGFDKKFFKYWFLHALALWVFFVIVTTGNYMLGAYKVGSYYITNEDGTHISGLQYFEMYNLGLIPLLTSFIVSFLIEYDYKWSFKDSELDFKMAISKCSFSVVMLTQYYYWFIAQKGYALRDILGVAVAFVIYFLAYSFVRYTIENRERAAQLREQQIQAELNSLKAQLNPHFFFNTLNNLYGTALQENAPHTVEMIEQLSSIMRYMMAAAHENFTDVKKELDFIDNYWALQKVRLPERKDIEIIKNVDFDGQPTQIAPLLLISFIENAFKYGISIDHPCKIDLNLVVKNQELTMTISNIIQGNHSLEKKNGIGVENTKKRLDLIYADKYTLKQTQNNDIQHGKKVYKVTLNLKLS